MPDEAQLDAVRTMVVWCADWPVAAHGVAPEESAAVFVGNRVVACSAGARAHGVRRGMRRREAQGRCPELVVLDRDEALEARTFEAVARAIESFSPRLEIVRPGTCALPTRGPSRYFGGDDTLAARVYEQVSAVLAGRTTCRVGVADGAFTAEIAARYADPPGTVVAPGASAAFLAPLPIRLLDRPPLVEVLSRLGMGTLGSFAALDPASVVGRFGAEGRTAHRLTRGLDEHPPDARNPPPDLRVTTEVDPPAEQVGQLAFLARELAEDLHAALDSRGLACTRVAIEAETENGEHLVRLWRHEGALSAGAVADRVRWQIDGWLHAPVAERPTSGIVHLGLVPDEVIAATGRQLSFWGEETEADARAARALVRLSSMLGADAVLVPERAGGRGPGDAVRLVPAIGVDLRERDLTSGTPAPGSPGSPGAATPVVAAPWPGRVPAPSPAVVHGAPRPASVQDVHGHEVEVSGRGLVSGTPVTVAVDGAVPVTLVGWAGPWMLDERWWKGSRSRAARLQLLAADGRAWLARREHGHWWIEASYD